MAEALDKCGLLKHLCAKAKRGEGASVAPLYLMAVFEGVYSGLFLDS